jgi:hypothetical protein
MNISTAMNRTLQCASVAKTGSDLEVPEMSRLHTEYITAGEQLIQLFFDQ